MKPDMKADEFVSLAPRKKPTQKRSRERVDSILDACADLLDEVGPDGVNTNTIAERAHIPVSSLYQYFPNKHAVLIELMARQLEEVDAVGKRVAEELSADSSWQEACDRILESYLEFCEKLPGFTPLWHTIQAHPDLYQTSSRQLVERLTSLRDLLAAYIAVHAPDRWSDDQVAVMQQTVIEAVIPPIGRASRLRGEAREKLMKEIRTLTHGYLSAYLES